MVRPDRLWAVGGVIGAIVLLTLGWFFLVGPRNQETAALHDQAISTEQKVASLQRRLIELRKQHADFPAYQARLARDRQALPTDAGLADFLRETQAAGDSTGVQVTGFNAGDPAEVAAPGAKLSAVPVTLTVEGDTANLRAFLDQLQQIQPRAALITSVSLVPDEGGASIAGRTGLTLGMQVFFAPPAAATAATPTASPAPAPATD
jgi:Tfp pilus assembly protein PilO